MAQSDNMFKRTLKEHRLSSLCAQRSFTPLLLGLPEAAGLETAGRTGQRPVFLVSFGVFSG
jgi:hypothetical protein